MTYNAYDGAKPAPSSQNVPTAFDSTRYNLQALRDMVVAHGDAPGFAYSYTGTSSQPTTELLTRGTEIVKLVNTWSGSTLTKTAYYYSSNTGTSYDGMKDASGNFVESFSYDGSGYLTSTSWGTST